HIAGLLAGSHGMPVTVLALDANAERDQKAAECVRRAANQAGAKRPDMSRIDVIIRKHELAPEQALAEEARRGYDLLVVGIARVAAPRGGFHEDLSSLVGKFEGSLAVVAAHDRFEQDPAAPIENILAPVTGNENSRRGAEVAVTLARAARARISA